MPVPFLNLNLQHQPLRTQFDAAIGAVIDSGAFAGGPFVASFEEDFAAYCGSRYAVGLGSGTEALWLTLLALGIGPGDEVITVAHTFMATAEAISFTGAKPVFVDIDEQTYTMDPALLKRAITPRTKAIIPVHIFGQTADLDPILDVAKSHGLPVIEDACQAHGALYKERKAGSIGVTGCFSFNPGKNLGALGEAGAVVTQDTEIAKKIRALRDHGQFAKYHHSAVGWNCRMDGIQAAVLQIKLRHLDQWNRERRARAQLYQEKLGSIEEIIPPITSPHSQPVYHLFAVRVKNRDEVLESLGQMGIACGVHYPVPIHLQQAYRFLGIGEGSLPVTERCAREFLSLPIYPELTPEQVGEVCDGLKKVLRGKLEPRICADRR